MYACEGGSRELVKLLLDEGAKLDYVGSERIEGRNGYKRVSFTKGSICPFIDYFR